MSVDNPEPAFDLRFGKYRFWYAKHSSQLRVWDTEPQANTLVACASSDRGPWVVNISDAIAMRLHAVLLEKGEFVFSTLVNPRQALQHWINQVMRTEEEAMETRFPTYIQGTTRLSVQFIFVAHPEEAWDGYYEVRIQDPATNGSAPVDLSAVTVRLGFRETQSVETTQQWYQLIRAEMERGVTDAEVLIEKLNTAPE